MLEISGWNVAIEKIGNLILLFQKKKKLIIWIKILWEFGLEWKYISIVKKRRQSEQTGAIGKNKKRRNVIINL